MKRKNSVIGFAIFVVIVVLAFWHAGIFGG